MNVGQLIKKLGQFNPSLEVAILDGFNGGGNPRTINLGPCVDGDEHSFDVVGHKSNLDYSDLETYQGNAIVVMGYGCY